MPNNSESGTICAVGVDSDMEGMEDTAMSLGYDHVSNPSFQISSPQKHVYWGNNDHIISQE